MEPWGRECEEAPARIRGLKRGGSRLAKLGGLESHNDVTGRTAVSGTCRQAACSQPGRTAAGAAGLPAWDGVIEECGLLPVQGSVMVLLPLGVDPHPEAVFLF